jgi:hypothetical protein
MLYYLSSSECLVSCQTESHLLYLPSVTTACQLESELCNSTALTMHRDATTKKGRHFYGVEFTAHLNWWESHWTAFWLSNNLFVLPSMLLQSVIKHVVLFIKFATTKKGRHFYGVEFSNNNGQTHSWYPWSVWRKKHI